MIFLSSYFLVIDERYPNVVKVFAVFSGQVQITRTASGRLTP